jgi:hypothetical protein
VADDPSRLQNGALVKNEVAKNSQRKVQTSLLARRWTSDVKNWAADRVPIPAVFGGICHHFRRGIAVGGGSVYCNSYRSRSSLSTAEFAFELFTYQPKPIQIHLESLDGSTT